MNRPTSDEDLDTKTARLRHHSGVLYLARHESVPILLDAQLDLPSGREFNKSELASHAGVTRRTVASYIGLLLEVDIVEEVPDTSPWRYRVAESPVVQELVEFNSALNATAE